MNMKDWAKEEVRIACERERGEVESYEWDYSCACYESALKAFNVLLEDKHSGMSIDITRQILNRLINGNPLTPIEDTEDVWAFAYECNGEKKYQCKRMSSLFKVVKADGSVTYSDVDRIICQKKMNDELFYSGFVRDIVDEICPITCPYVPSNKPYIVTIAEFLVDEKNGDFDTIGIADVLKPDGTYEDIYKFFKEGENGWEEIDCDEYIDRYERRKEKK